MDSEIILMKCQQVPIMLIFSNCVYVINVAKCKFDPNETIITPHNVGSVLWRLFSTLEVVQYIGGCSVHRGITSVLWGDSFSTVGIASVLWRLFSTVGG